MASREQGRSRNERRRPLLARLGLRWWMPAIALLAPIGFGVYRAFAGQDGAGAEFLRALLWPGAALYVVALAIVWAGWTLELE